jgi:hypothetical protein
MSRYREESRVNQGSRYANTRPSLTPAQIADLQDLLNALRDREATYAQLTGDRNDFQLERVIVHRLTTDASRTITGFNANNLSGDIQVIANVGSNDLVLANNSGSSSAVNRILCHTGANITLNPNESVPIFYDKTSARVRTIGFV